MEAHRYQNINDALNAISLINQSQGIPKSEKSVTQSYTDFIEGVDSYFIMADDVTKSVLGVDNLVTLTENDFEKGNPLEI
jgi:hypothetical protein